MASITAMSIYGGNREGYNGGSEPELFWTTGSVTVGSSGDEGIATRYSPHGVSSANWGWTMASGTASIASGDTSSGSRAWLILTSYPVDNPSDATNVAIGSRTSAGNINASNEPLGRAPGGGAKIWLPNTKYRVSLNVRRRIAGNQSSAPTIAEMENIDDYFGPILAERWTTVWTNRSAEAPVITSPPTNSTIVFGSGSGSMFDLQWDLGTDPDSTGTASVWEKDYMGWEVQYRPMPSTASPNPSWENFYLTDTTEGEVFTNRMGWYAPGSPDPLKGYADDQKLTLIADESYLGSYTGLYGRLQPGRWQFRIRTLDSGSFNPRTAGNYARADWPASWEDQSAYSAWSEPVTLYIEAPFLPPLPVSPVNETAIEVSAGSTINFEWQFRDPRDNVSPSQSGRRVRVRRQGDPSWTEIILGGDQVSNESTYAYVNSGVPLLFEAGYRYEWQAFTTAIPGDYESGWSQSAYFWTIPPAGSGSVFPVPTDTFPSAGLGCGVNRVFLFRKGGEVPLGEITGASLVDWGRVRDDISDARIVVPVASADSNCRDLLANTRSWLHEIVIFRDAGNGPVRVWEGPVTRVTYENDKVEIAARDVMYWVYRRILRQGYNDAYRKGGGGLTRVTIRSQRIVQNALAYDDPNILPYLTSLTKSDDARQSRVVPDYSRTAWQEVDDMAAKSGSDYTTVGRRIIIWDTHNPIGVLPEMRDGDFESGVIVTEYGAQAANVYASTNNNGIYGIVERDFMRDEYGSIEMLNSAWGEEDEAGTTETLTSEAREKLEESLTEQAERNISARWPVPVVVRVPDNSTLNPDVQLGINQLIPGVHIPLRATQTLRKVAQVQKLDVVKVTQTSSGEQVRVTMSPAPRGNEDPDSEGGEE